MVESRSAPVEEADLEPEMSVGMYDLVLAFREILKRAEEKPTMDVSREEFSIEQMMGFSIREHRRGARKNHFVGSFFRKSLRGEG